MNVCDLFNCPDRSIFTSDQRSLNKLYSGVSIAYFACILFWMFGYSVLVAGYNAIFPSNDHVGDAKDIAFRTVSDGVVDFSRPH